MVRALLAAGADRNIDRSRGNETESTAALAARMDEEGAALCAALYTTAGWTPENHKFFSRQLHEQVRTVLLVAKAAHWSLPGDALHKIFEALTAPAPGTRKEERVPCGRENATAAQAYEAA
jgi:hypothetical protein